MILFGVQGRHSDIGDRRLDEATGILTKTNIRSRGEDEEQHKASDHSGGELQWEVRRGPGLQEHRRQSEGWRDGRGRDRRGDSRARTRDELHRVSIPRPYDPN